MPANPFYVDPMADYSQGLAGLTQSVKQIGQQKKADEIKAKSEERFTAAKTAYQEAAKSGDANKLADVVLEYPELSKAFMVSQGIRDKGKADEASAFMKTVLTADEADIPDLYKERIQSVKGRDGNVEQSAESYMRWASNPKAEKKNMELVLASTDPEGYKALVKQRESETKKKTFQQGSGKMSGYVFDQESGKYSIDPVVKQQLTDKAKAEAEKEGKLDVKVTRDINKDVTGLLKGTKDIHDAANSLDTLKSSSSPVSQLAAVFKLMKALDPASVVREGEQQQARSTGGPADALVGYVNKIRGEGGLPPRVFTDMVDTAKRLANSASESAGLEVSGYLDAYEGKLGQSFKDRLLKRIPGSFEVGEPVQEPVDTQITAEDFRLKSKEEQAKIIADIKAKGGK